jgi:hypothetical protein
VASVKKEALRFGKLSHTINISCIYRGVPLRVGGAWAARVGAVAC